MTQPPPRDNSSRATNWLLGAIVLLLAVVAVLLVLVFGNLSDGDDAAGSVTTTSSTTTTTVADTTTSTSPDTTTSTTTSTSTTTTTEPPTTTTTLAENERAAIAAVTAWIDALADGRADASWALVAPASQELIGGRTGYDEVFSGLVEGFGAWASATDPNGEGSPWLFVNEVDDQILVVTLAGLVTQEGTTSLRAASIPVVVIGDTVAVQPFLRLDPVQWSDPAFTAEPWPLAPSTMVTVTVPGAPLVRSFFNADEIEITLEPGEGVTSVVSEPLTSLEAGGTYVLTVVLLDEEVLHADAVVVVASESS